MKTVIFLLLCGIAFCSRMKPAADAPVSSAPPAAAASDSAAASVDFQLQIQPILETRCSPCHFPGGKMYEKMPFDQAHTIVEHSEGLLKRISDEGENKLFKQFLEESAAD